MKLLTRTNIYFITITLIVFALSGGVFYKTLRYITRQDATERLEDERNKILDYVKIHHTLPQNSISLGDTIAFYPSATPVEEKTGHAKLFNPNEKEYEPYQTIEFTANLNGLNYRTVIFRPLLEEDDLQQAIFEAIGIVSIILLIVMVVTNFITSRLLWKPFYATLEKIKAFDLTKEGDIEFKKTTVKEFSEMNNVLKAMTHKMSSDYKSLKEFTENASHELQTPLSIILSKLELMIQSETLSEKQMEGIQAVYEAAGRLSKLNQALLLLAKIENKQFAETKHIAFNELVENKLEAFDELLKHKNIAVAKSIKEVFVEMHPILADILLSNLIGNAIKHNVNGGRLNLSLDKEQLIISNSGSSLLTPPHELFQRFRKASQSSDSLGLGLAIVKEICEAYHFDIQYSYIDGVHAIRIKF